MNDKDKDMIEKEKSNWLRDILLVPLIVGLILILFQSALPILSEKHLELSYSIEEPRTQFDKTVVNTKSDIKVEINGVETSRIISQSIRFWNSGQIPIKDLSIKYIYDISDPTFKIFQVTHDTEPKYEFGNITLKEETSNSEKYYYELLNPSDEFTITFLTNKEAILSVFAKAEGLTVKRSLNSEKSLLLSTSQTIIVEFVTFIATIISVFIMRYLRKE